MPSMQERYALMLREALPPDERSLPALIERAAARDPDKLNIRIGARTLTFGQTRERAAAVAGQLAARGIRPGDRVALMCRNRMEFIEFFAAAFWLRAIVVPVNPALRGAQLAHVFRLSGARLLVVDGDLFAPVAAMPVVDTLEEVWPLEAPPEASHGNATTLPFRVVGAPEHSQPVERVRIGHGDPSAILFTSGTTGPAKGALCPAAQFYWWAEYQTAAMQVTRDSVMMNVLPLYHINAINTFVQSLLTGASCIIGERFSASTFWSTAAEHGVTHSSLIGSMANFLLAQPPSPEDRAHGLRTLIASSIRADYWLEIKQRFGVPQRVGGYGSTEMNLVFNADDGWETPGNMGFATAGFEVRVFDAEDNELPDGTPGEMVVRCAVPFATFLCYWGNPEATVNAFRNLWFHTGDLVVREAGGRFRFCGRLKESIRRSGENISSWEVEQALLEHPAIAEAAAFGVPSDVTGEEVMAALVWKPGMSADYAEVCQFLEAHLARFAIPRFLEAVDALPLTETGKINRARLAQRGVTATTWDRGPAAVRSVRAAPAAPAAPGP